MQDYTQTHKQTVNALHSAVSEGARPSEVGAVHTPHLGGPVVAGMTFKCMK